ncbi:MAG TPA: 4Fe-4S binding protein [Spirochaetota bacterium]|nr:4Fe-4S binding protein [Spirochaetota bacterium]
MLNISKNKCVGCGLCEQDCKGECISLLHGIACIDQDSCLGCGDCTVNCPQDAIRDITRTYLFAIGTDDHYNIKSDDHVGMSRSFQVWQYKQGAMKFVEKRSNPKVAEDESYSHGDPAKAKSVGSALKGIDVLIGTRFGPNIVRLLKKFVCAVARCDSIVNVNRMIRENINEIAAAYEKHKRSGIVLN